MPDGKATAPTHADLNAAGRTPTAETLAIRALRDVRKLDARLAKAEQEVTAIKAERTALLGGLPEEATRILKTLQAVK
jgi:hypothetical protein